MSTLSADARQALPVSAFYSAPLWILQRISEAQADESSSFMHELQGIIQTATTVFNERIADGDVLSTDDVTGILGRVDGAGQCLMHTLRTSAGTNEHPSVLRTQFLEEIQQQPRTLLGLLTASESIRDEYCLDFNSPEAVANFADKYIAGHYESGCPELLWAAKRWKRHIAIVSHVTDFPWYAVTGIFPNYQHSNSEVLYICAGQVSAVQLLTPMIFHPNGALLNPHAASQLSHFAPITCVTNEAISQADRLDICRILLHLDPNEMLVRSSAGDINDLSAVDIDAFMAAQHAHRRVSHNDALKHFQRRLGTAMMLPFVGQWKQFVYSQRRYGGTPQAYLTFALFAASCRYL